MLRIQEWGGGVWDAGCKYVTYICTTTTNVEGQKHRFLGMTRKGGINTVKRPRIILEGVQWAGVNFT